jgi:hypothetical protein
MQSGASPWRNLVIKAEAEVVIVRKSKLLVAEEAPCELGLVSAIVGVTA